MNSFINFLIRQVKKLKVEDIEFDKSYYIATNDGFIHRKIKNYVTRELESLGYQCTQEKLIFKNDFRKRIADVYGIKGFIQVDIEIQHSVIDEYEFKKRFFDFSIMMIRPIWIFDINLLKKKEMKWLCKLDYIYYFSYINDEIKILDSELEEINISDIVKY